jgi:hypothetical protein
LPENIYPYALYVASVSILLMFSLRSHHIVGYDINKEYEIFQVTKNNLLWNFSSYPHDYNSSLSISILPSIISLISNIKDYPNKRRIISTDIVGVAEEIRENNCRIIIKPKDSKDLAEAMITLLKNPKLAKKIGGNGRRLVENKYFWEQIMERIEQVYKEACI